MDLCCGKEKYSAMGENEGKSFVAVVVLLWFSGGETLLGGLYGHEPFMACVCSSSPATILWRLFLDST